MAWLNNTQYPGVSNNINFDKPLNVGTFNCRGLKKTRKVHALLNTFKKEKLDIIGLQETHINTNIEIEEIRKKWRGPLHYSEGTNNSKGLITLFSPINFSESNLTLLYKSERILISSLIVDKCQILILNVYSPCAVNDKTNFLNNLNSVLDDILNTSDGDPHNIICLGDFNLTLEPRDILDNGHQHNHGNRQHLNKILNDHNLTDTWRLDHPFESTFTWSTPNFSAARRLDYIFINDPLSSYICDSYIKNIGFSDHRLMYTVLEFSTFSQGKGLYKMNTSLFKDLDYCRIINREISDTINEHKNLNPHLIMEMIKVNCKEITQQYSKFRSREQDNKSVLLSKTLNDLDNELIKDPNNKVLPSKIASIKKELEIFELEQARGAQIRSSIKSIEDGEKCTKYFFALEKHMSQINTVKKLKTADGIISNETEIVNKIGEHYEKKYNTSNKSYEFVSKKLDEYTENIDLPKLSEEERETCDRVITIQEVADSVKSMNRGSAPGSDGIPAEFYVVFWNYIRYPLLECFKYSFEKRLLPTSERLGVISLFHKGKDLDRDNLDNWRPISLTNADYKILAKLLSRRLNKVIDKLIGLQQTGFMKGRHISTLHRQIDDILTLQRKKKLPGILLALDFKAAFDSINISTILKSLTLFGFGEKFVTWIKILNTERLACIKNGGHISYTFKMGNGVRQGCPVSPQLFILAVEILAQKIVQDNSIKGLNPNGNKIPFKLGQFADDTTCGLNDIEDMRKVMNHLNGFSTFSDLFLNLNKSYALSTNGMAVDTDGLQITFKNQIKILGLYFGNLTEASLIEENWKSRIENVKKMLTTWNKRNLSLAGKILILKTFGLSQFVFVMQSISLPEMVLKEISQIFFHFLWKSKNSKGIAERVKRPVLCNEVEFGGLKMVDIYRFQDSALLNWAVMLLSNKYNLQWKHYATSFFDRLGGKSVFLSKANNITNFNAIDSVASVFWKTVLTKWLNNADNRNRPNTIADPLFNNPNVTYKGKMLYLPTCISKGISIIADLLNGDNIISLLEFHDKVGKFPRSILDYNLLYNSLNRVLVNHDPILSTTYYFRGKPIDSLNRRQFYQLLNNNCTPVCVELWERKLGILLEKSHWSIIKQLKESRLKSLWWKIVHNIFPTNSSLYKMKISKTDKCQYCNKGQLDNLVHFFVECPSIKPLWAEVSSFILKKTNKPMHITVENIILGVRDKLRYAVKELSFINWLIAIGKLVISKFKYGPQRNLIEIFETECRLRKLK